MPGVRGHTGEYTLNLGAVTNTISLLIDAEPDDALKDVWNLTDKNSYSSAVLAWLMDKYGDYTPDDLSRAAYRDLAYSTNIALTLTEMYWLDIPPVHAAPIYGGSNIWFVAGMGTLANPVSGGAREPDVEPHVTVRPDGSIISNIYMTVTMMITNRSPLASRRVWPPDRFNGHVYSGAGSSGWKGGPAWTSVVFNVTGALQKEDVSATYLPLQQYVFTSDSFGAADGPHPFQTRVEVVDPFAPNTMGDYYGWSKYRNIYSVFYRWVIKSNSDGRVSPVPLVPKWSTP